MPGGKSRKSGGVSRTLINKIKSGNLGNIKKGPGNASSKKSSGKKSNSGRSDELFE